jgi:peptidyl-prolyl cis-trans isomerase D
MLNFFRKHSQSLLMWLLVAAIGFIFIVQFGPQSRGCRSRTGAPAYVAKVQGSVISEESFRWAWIISRASSIPRDQGKAMRLKEAVLDGLIERELLAQAAEDMGIKVAGDDIDRNILEGTIYYNASVHFPIRMPSGPIPIDFTRDDGSFDYENFKMFVNGQFQMSVQEFEDEQVREVLAYKMRTLIENSVELYPGEVRDEYEKQSNWLKVETATFDPLDYAESYSFTDGEIERWARDNEDLVTDDYKENEFRYKNMEKQVRIRNILIEVQRDSEEEAAEEKRKLAESIYEKASRGENFESLARKHSDDEQTRDEGGDNGYRARGHFEEVVEDAAFGMEPGEVKGPIETEEGFQIIKCEGFREGNVPLEEVRLEIAEHLMKEKKSEKEAKEDAESFLELVKTEDDFEKAAEKLRENKRHGVAGESEEDAFADIPDIRTSSEIGKGDTHIAGIGTSKDLTSELFGIDSGKLLERVAEANGKFHVLKVAERHEGSESEFREKSDIIERRLLGEKKLAIVEQWIDARRKKAEDERAVSIEKAYVQYPGDEIPEETGD